MTDYKEQLEAFFKERNEAFENDDIDWARRNMPFPPTSYRVAVIAFHKARERCLAISEGKRAESRKWLTDNGYGVMK